VKRALVGISLMLCLGACLWSTSRIDTARAGFRSAFYCPDDRLQARRREDLRPSDAKRAERPPAELANDPERLGMWRSEQRENREFEDSYDEIYEVNGCGHDELYACHRTRGGVACSVFRLREP
jgi:hypothetical protein